MTNGEEREKRTIALLGNSNPQETHEIKDAKGTVIKRVQAPHPYLRQSVTRVEMRPGFDDPDHVAHSLSTDNDRHLSLIGATRSDEHRVYTIGIHEVEDLLAVHSAGSKPDWVASSDPVFAQALATYFGCPATDFVEDEDGTQIGGPTNLLTNAGRDAWHAQHLGTSAQPAAFFYGALSANTGSGFAATDTALAGEITTAGGGLIRKAMTYAHTAGTNTSTLTATWTANGSDVLPVTIASWANFNASTAGTISDEAPLSSGATLNVSGDSLTVTFTQTAG